MEFRTSNNISQSFQKPKQPTVGVLYNLFVRAFAKFNAQTRESEPASKAAVHSNPDGRVLSCGFCVNGRPCRTNCRCECHIDVRAASQTRDVPDAPNPFAIFHPQAHTVFNCALNGCGRRFGRSCDCDCH